MVAATPGFERFAAAAANETSQFGEDGIIKAILAEIGERNRWCFEVGAHDGLYYSNTKRLRDVGWNAVLIEADERNYQKLKAFESPSVRCVHKCIAPGDLDTILAECGAPTDIDLGVIDIDGDDWFILEGMGDYRPRILMVEFRNGDADYMPPFAGGGVMHQAGRNPICAAAGRKGYFLVCTTDVNGIFVRHGEL